MVITKSLASLCVAIGLAGCAIHPVVQDVTGHDTYQIVRQIRCEARDTVRSKVIGLLQNSKSLDTQNYAEELKVHPESFEHLNNLRLDTLSRALIEKYEPVAVAYEFTFDITEDNELDGTIDLIRPFRHGSRALGLNVANDRQRHSNRDFMIADSFKELMQSHFDCSGEPDGQNWIYPIAGKIGLHEVISTFLDLNESGNLASKDKDKVAVLSEIIEFTTQFSGGVHPKITLIPIGHGFQTQDAFVNITSSRKDIHKVAIALSLPTPVVEAAPTKKQLRPAQASSAKANALQELIYQNPKTLSIPADIVRKLQSLE